MSSARTQRAVSIVVVRLLDMLSSRKAFPVRITTNVSPKSITVITYALTQKAVITVPAKLAMH